MGGWRSRMWDRDSGAAEAGILPGDVLLEANGELVENRLDLTREINLNGGSEMTVLVERDGRQETMALRPPLRRGQQPLAGRGDRGAGGQPGGAPVPGRSGRRCQPASWGTWELLLLLKQSVTGMVVGGGGAGAFRAHRDRADDRRGQPERGAGGLAERRHTAEHQPGDHHILPFPMLDGGRIVFVVIEWVRRGKRISPEKEGLIHLVGLAVIVAGVVAISANDIMRLIEGGRFLGG